jgi:hypothetical protein
MYRKTSPDKELLDNSKEALISDPTNIDAASRCWKALGSWQSGGHVIEAFRAAALASREGVVAFARAYRELFENSGEAPRPVLFDDELFRALKASVAGLPENERVNLQWVLESLRSSGA